MLEPLNARDLCPAYLVVNYLSKAIESWFLFVDLCESIIEVEKRHVKLRNNLNVQIYVYIFFILLKSLNSFFTK